jgi:hypothetical protein
MKLYRIVDKSQNYTMHWTCDYSIIQHYLNNQAYYSSDYKDKDRIFVESVTIPEESLEPELEEAYEWNKNKLTTITKKIY